MYSRKRYEECFVSSSGRRFHDNCLTADEMMALIALADAARAVAFTRDFVEHKPVVRTFPRAANAAVPHALQSVEPDYRRGLLLGTWRDTTGAHFVTEIVKPLTGDDIAALIPAFQNV